MDDNKGKNTLMILLTALGALAIIVLIGWVAFFNPMDNMDTQEKPQLALSSLNSGGAADLPEKKAEDLLIDSLQKGEETPLIIEEEDESGIVITMEPEPEEKEIPAPVQQPAAVVKPAEPVKTVTYKEVTEPIYWLQVGSFPNSVSADKLRTSLKEKGIDSVMQTRTVDGTLYYRVRVGAFSQKDEAEAFKSKLLSLDEIEDVTLYTDSVTKTVVAY